MGCREGYAAQGAAQVNVVAYVPDLMDRSRFSALPPEVVVTFVQQPQALATADADVIIADLGRPGVIDAMTVNGRRKVGFLSHVDGNTREQAVAAGIQVYARSRFFSRLTHVITDNDGVSE